MTEYEIFADLFGDDMANRRGYFYTKPIESLVDPAFPAEPKDSKRSGEELEHWGEVDCGICGARGMEADATTGNIQAHGFCSPLWAGLNRDFCEIKTCEACYKKTIPYAVKLRDILELRMYVNKLKRVIYERNKSENNRKYANDAGQRS